MKKFSLLLVFATCTTFLFGQNGTYISYDIEVSSEDESMSMMISMFDASTMQIAANENRTYVKTSMGMISNTEIELDRESDSVTMYMTGMMGKMAFADHKDSLAGDDSETPETTIEFLKESKKVLGYKCKKAVATDNSGNTSIYWYAVKLDRPEGIDNMPEEIPGLCLEMTVTMPTMEMTYTANSVSIDADISKYSITIPEDVEIQSFKEMGSMVSGM